MSAADIARWMWESDTMGAKIARTMLWPASLLFSAIVRVRNEHFDSPHAHTTKRGSLRIRPTVLPAISIGNLTVGGTGKTPVAAWCARELARRGARPSIILRGYGDDEWKVHALLNPGVPVIVSPDRLMGITSASVKGANCAVMDDAFQHRQAARVADIVLLSADRWNGTVRLLPAGPYREPLASLRRATVAVITVKAAPAERVADAEAAIAREVPGLPVSVMRLSLGSLHLATGLPAPGADGAMRGQRPDRSGMLDHPASWLAGRRILAVSAIGDPGAFTGQLERAGAAVTLRTFRDHHDFSATDAESVARAAEGLDGVVCTLKDAVKLGTLWPRLAPPLWYVSQHVVVERGAEALEHALARVLAGLRSVPS